MAQIRTLALYKTQHKSVMRLIIHCALAQYTKKIIYFELLAFESIIPFIFITVICKKIFIPSSYTVIHNKIRLHNAKASDAAKPPVVLV